MRHLFLHRLRYKFLQWGGHADARPTEFAATLIGAERRARDEWLRSSQPPASPAWAASPKVPVVSRIGRYVIKGRLGSGGLGEVFDAWDPLLSRAVAVKTLRLQLDARLRALLDDHILKEARAAAGLSHPNIVTVFDAGLCAPGVYIAMERLHGRDLREALATGWQPTPRQAALLARQVAEALAYAHGKGVVHCDIKPANIFLDHEDRPKVLDFGIARMAHANQQPGTEDPLFGSPHYLAPEQLQSGVVDARTDIRALGVVFYEMLTGRKAFDGDTVEQVIDVVLSHQPAPAHEACGGVPRALSAIAAKAMAREPERRYAHAEEMARELREWGDRHAEAAPDPAAAKSRASTGRAAVSGRETSTGWRLAGLVLCATTLAWLWWLPSSSPAPRVQQVAAQSAPPNAGQRAAPGTTQNAPQRATQGQAGTPSSAPTTAAADLQPAGATVAASPAAAPVFAQSRPQVDQSSGSIATPAGPTTAGAGTRPLGGKEGAAQAFTQATPPATTKATTSATTPATARATATEAANKRKPQSENAAGSGAVLLSISPWGQVEVNGQTAGTTPPLSRLSLPAGRHTITVRNEDFPIYTTTVLVQADKPALVRHRFVQ